MRKKQNIESNHEENVFALSTGDLMAGLLFIFILLLMGALLQVEEQAEKDKELTDRYDNTKTHLYIDLQAEFKKDLAVWGAVMDSTMMSIRFQEPSMLFDEGRSDLKPLFKDILDDFFPRYIEVLGREEYRDKIREIRIEGHTNSNGDYFSNMELSQDRTRTVLQYCLSITPSDKVEWLREVITANGLSSSHPVMHNGVEDKNLSRRIEFRIRTNAEEVLEEIRAIRLKEKHE